MEPIWLMLLAGVSFAGDCSYPSYTSLTYSHPYVSGGLKCAGIIETSTYADTSLPPPWIPTAPPPSLGGAWKWVGDAILISETPGQQCLTSCTQTAISLPTGGGVGHVFSLTKTRSQSSGFNWGLLGPLFNYLAGPSWTSSSTFGTVCASQTTITPPVVTISSGQRRAYAIYAHTLKYFEKRSSGSTNGWREETYQYPSLHEGGIGNYNASYDFCAGTWSSASCFTATITPCTATVTVNPTLTF